MPSCSLNAHAQKVLVRREQSRINQATLVKGVGMEQTGAVGPTRVPFLGGQRASLEGACISFDARSEGRFRPKKRKESFGRAQLSRPSSLLRMTKKEDMREVL